MEIIKYQSLKMLNTFGIDVVTKFFTELKEVEEIIELFRMPEYKKMNRLIIGRGSNILFSKDFDGIVIKIENKGISIEKEDNEFVYLKIAAGEDWEDLINYCIKNNYGGIENLTMIPGKVGSSPIQNIGAYGVELKNVFFQLEAINITTLTTKKFSKDECAFAYRDSIFKKKLKDKYIITSVTLKLIKDPVEFNLKYGILDKELRFTNDLTINIVVNAIRNIRKRKLPDIEVLGSAGSFFKNPIIDTKLYEKLKHTHSAELPGFIVSASKVKVPAAWLIEHSGLKGKKIGNVSVYKNQPLVIVNHGGATGKEILSLAEHIKETVFDKFGITLETEVIVV